MLYNYKFNRLNGFADLETFHQSFSLHLQDNLYSHADFDLNKVDFIPPEALLPLLCASRVWYETKGIPVSWHFSNEDTVRYLERIDLFAAANKYIAIDHLPNNLWTRSTSNKLMELTLIADTEKENERDVNNIVHNATGILLGRIDPKRLGTACTLLSEVCQNIIHSYSTGYALMQIYKSGSGHRVHIGIADVGKGIPNSLSKKYPNVGNPSDYILKSLESGVSSLDSSRGIGLYQVEQIVRKGSGTLTIRSDTGMAQIYNDRIYKWDDLPYIYGTQVYITIWGRHDQGDWNYLLPSV